MAANATPAPETTDGAGIDTTPSRPTNSESPKPSKSRQTRRKRPYPNIRGRLLEIEEKKIKLEEEKVKYLGSIAEAIQAVPNILESIQEMTNVMNQFLEK